MMARKKRDTAQVLAAVVDMGHSLLKVGVRTIEGEWAYDVAPHALHKIPRRKWEQIVERAGTQKNARDYVQVGQQYFILGDSAERYGHSTRAMGAARYVREYIGVQAATMIARISPYADARVEVMALHPPGDAEYRKELRASIVGKWDLLLGDGNEYMFTIDHVHAVDEPYAGLMNIAINEKLMENQTITGGEGLVLDIGGGTTNVAPYLPGGSVDYGRIDSYPMGILNVISKLEKNLKNNHREIFKRARQIGQDRLRDALITGRFKGGGRTIQCKDEVRSAKSELLAEIERMYMDGAIGGPLGFDIVILTGGGSVAMGDDLADLLGHRNIKYAHSDLANIHFANVHGAGKLFDVLEDEGKIQL
jgi:hypothetical protein